MALTPITHITGTAVYIPGNNIDTDRIVPARFLRDITFTHMGEYLFYDERFGPDDTPRDFPLNAVYDVKLLIVDANFGCGSSREHAPQAIKKYGIQGIIGKSFSDIFRGNCHALGIPCVILDDPSHQRLKTSLDTRITLDIASTCIRTKETELPFILEPAVQQAFISGEWQVKALLKTASARSKAIADKLPYIHNYAPR